MAVYFKFKSAKDYYSIPVTGQFVSVACLKEKIFRSNRFGKGVDFDLVISNAQTNEEYVEAATLIPKNASVLVQRLPGIPRKPIIAETDKPKIAEDKLEDTPSSCISSMEFGDFSTLNYPEESEMDDFGSDLFSEVFPAQSSAPKDNSSPAINVDEDSKIKDLVNTPALDWNCPGNSCGNGFVLRRGGSIMGGCGSGPYGLEKRTLHAGYVCHRCNLKGHFIQHCPTNGDPDYDRKMVKPPTGFPKSMLGGAIVSLKPNKAAFVEETERSVLSSCVNDVPPELWCPLCKEVMKDAVIAGKCCFKSYCDKCIRAYIITKSKCFCSASNVSADSLISNATIREAISRILESRASSVKNSGSSTPVRDASKDGPEESCLVDHSKNKKEPERNGNYSLLTKKHPVKSTTNAVKELPESITAEGAPPSVKEAALIAGVTEKRKVKKRMSGNTAAGEVSGYNLVGNAACMPPFSFANAYADQCWYYYNNQSNCYLAGLWMNGASVNQHRPPLVRQADVKRKPDIEEECYRNWETRCQRNSRVAAGASSRPNGSIFQAKRVRPSINVINLMVSFFLCGCAFIINSKRFAMFNAMHKGNNKYECLCFNSHVVWQNFN